MTLRKFNIQIPENLVKGQELWLTPLS
jgi:hypothetical protein